MIPVYEPVLGEREAELVAECLRSGWVSAGGPYVEELERRWSAYCGRSCGVAVSSGTAALQLAVACLGLGPGDEILMPSFTMIACAAAAVHQGCVPVLVDANPRTWCLDVSQLAAAVTPRTRAIMPVHVYGHPADMDPVLALAEERGLAIIEDASEAHGAEYLSRRSSRPAWHRCGSFGDLSAFSFYANKVVTTGEGGMLVTDDPELAETARSLRNLDFRPGRRFYHERLGFNFRLTNLQAALGVAQLERVDDVIARKRRLAALYAQHLEGTPGLQLAPEEAWARSVFWMVGVVGAGDALDNRELASRLAERGVETRPFFLGLHEQPALQGRARMAADAYPVTERLARHGLYLPSSPTLTEGEVEYVAGAVRAAVAA